MVLYGGVLVLWNSVLELLITSITLLVLVVISGVFKKSGAYDFSFFCGD